jgi:hypothetical protein
MKDHRMVYDSGTRRILLFGGRNLNGSAAYNDIWAYDATAHTWTMLSPSMKPSPRWGFAMAYDSSKARTLVWGGFNGGNGIMNDTWVFDGTNWSEIPGSAAQQWNPYSSMAYDAGRGRVVMHGGGSIGSPINDTFELVGDSWVQTLITPTDVPGPALESPTMAYDPSRGRIDVVGGGAVPTPTTLAYTYGAQATGKREGCRSGHDLDGDGLVGCADDDCWGICTPICPPGSTSASCPMQARCGDGTCDPVENCRNCPGDCPLGDTKCPVLCGDGFCDSTESAATCPGDCP